MASMLPIRRVVLYKHGVGYFERAGDVEGDQAIDLGFRASEMNDVLKSLTAVDAGGGTVHNISYESTKPVEKQLEEIAIDLPRRNVLTGLLTELKGARVTVAVAGREVGGEILGVEHVVEQAEGAERLTRTDHRLVLLVDGCRIETFALLEVQGLVVTDEKIQKDLGHLLGVLIASKQKDVKHLTIHARGQGTRSIVVGYVVETPVWKTSYRILLGRPDDDQEPRVQGWALVDNTQGEDWENVSLTLIAGLPISFVHDLYTARFRRRPVVEVVEEAAVGPPIVEDSYFGGEPVEISCMLAEPEAEAGVAYSRGGGGMAEAVGQAVDVQKRVLESGDLYAYQIENPVTVGRDRSALVPILSSGFAGRRVALYNREIRDRNPLSAVLFENTTGMTLEGGPATVFEGDDYVGEAMLETVKDGDRQILPFSVELGCRIAIDHRSTDEPVHRSTIHDGRLSLHYHRRRETIYRIANRGDRVLDLFLDHEFWPGSTLVEPDASEEETERFRRFRFDVAAGAEIEFVVVERGDEQNRIHLRSIERDQVEFFIQSGYLDARTEQEVRRLVEMQERADRVARSIREAEGTLSSISASQERLRKNLEVLGTRQEETELRQRYIRQLGAEEDRIQEVTVELEELRSEEAELRQTLGRALEELQFDAVVRKKAR